MKRRNQCKSFPLGETGGIEVFVFPLATLLIDTPEGPDVEIPAGGYFPREMISVVSNNKYVLNQFPCVSDSTYSKRKRSSMNRDIKEERYLSSRALIRQSKGSQFDFAPGLILG